MTHGSQGTDLDGDIAGSPRIVGLGVAAADAMLGQVDPLAAACDVVAGYHEAAPLQPSELEVLDAIIRTRLATSINPVVALLDAIPAAFATASFRNACGYLPVAAERDVMEYIGSAAVEPAPIVDADLASAQILDWGGADRAEEVPDDRPSLGRYGEVRSIYDTSAFATPFGERRTLHLGVDIFIADGQPASSPLDGVIHSRDVRDDPGDYGGVIIIEYRTPTNVAFWLLVGHLDHASVEQLTPGEQIDRGQEFARVGSRRENGGWAPHLHVQLFTDLLGQTTDLDGVARVSERDVWTSISPNPAALIVGVDRRAIDVAITARR